MDNDSAWKDNSSGELLQYDFFPPGDWTSEQVRAAQAAIAASIEAAAADGGMRTHAWLDLARRLPGPLRAALVAELGAGNQLVGIGSAGWPNDGSIVVNLRERFSVARQATPAGVAWRELDDPHYAREELSLRVGSVEHLIIT
jgi:hypothetical protein